MSVRTLFVLSVIIAACCSERRAAADDQTLVAHWDFDQVADGRCEDRTSRHVAILNGAQPVTKGTTRCLFLQGAREDFASLGTSVQLSDGNEVTIVAVVRARSFSAPDLQNRANSRNGILGSDDGQLIFSLTDRGRLTFVWDAGGHKYQSIVTDREHAVPVDQWCHVAAVRKGGLLKLFINGICCRVEHTAARGPFRKLGDLSVGRVNGSPSRSLDGWIDELRIYSRALTDARIQELATDSGLTGPAVLPRLGDAGLQRVPYNHPGLVVDLGVGLWAQPLPMDYDRDGDLDLVVSCADVPFNGTYLFENPGDQPHHDKLPVFRRAVRLGPGLKNVQVSFVDGQPRVLVPGIEYDRFAEMGIEKPRTLPLATNVHPNRVRANQWKYADYDGDGALDLLIGVGDWTDYGWDNAYDALGQWTHGPLHGYVYLARNEGSSEDPQYAQPVKVEADGEALDVYGMPSPNMADFDNDGDLDLLCGEFVDKFTYFENVGTRREPAFGKPRQLTIQGEVMAVDLCMHVPVAVDWDQDGDVDLIVGQEDGRVMFFEHSGRVVDGLPQFEPARFFQQEADAVKFGALVTPVSVDWDRDGDEDLICGNTAGQIAWIENLDGGFPPRWAAPVPLEADGEPIRIQAGYNGSIQGPCEKKWGYTTLSVADWDHDGLLDLVVNSIWGRVVWFRNVGTPEAAKLAKAEQIEVEWSGKAPKPAWNWWEPDRKALVTQWRTTPAVIDFDQDGLNDLAMLDQEGFLALFRRRAVDNQLELMPPQRLFVDAEGSPLKLSLGPAGKSGRRKLCFTDWDGDGNIDLLINDRNVKFLQGRGWQDERYVFEDQGPVEPRRLAGHTTSPTVVHWDEGTRPDLLVGAEDGFLYFMKNPNDGDRPKSSR